MAGNKLLSHTNTNAHLTHTDSHTHIHTHWELHCRSWM